MLSAAASIAPAQRRRLVTASAFQRKAKSGAPLGSDSPPLRPLQEDVYEMTTDDEESSESFTDSGYSIVETFLESSESSGVINDENAPPDSPTPGFSAEVYERLAAEIEAEALRQAVMEPAGGSGEITVLQEIIDEGEVYVVSTAPSSPATPTPEERIGAALADVEDERKRNEMELNRRIQESYKQIRTIETDVDPARPHSHQKRSINVFNIVSQSQLGGAINISGRKRGRTLQQGPVAPIQFVRVQHYGPTLKFTVLDYPTIPVFYQNERIILNDAAKANKDLGRSKKDCREIERRADHSKHLLCLSIDRGMTMDDVYVDFDSQTIYENYSNNAALYGMIKEIMFPVIYTENVSHYRPFLLNLAQEPPGGSYEHNEDLEIDLNTHPGIAMFKVKSQYHYVLWPENRLIQIKASFPYNRARYLDFFDHIGHFIATKNQTTDKVWLENFKKDLAESVSQRIKLVYNIPILGIIVGIEFSKYKPPGSSVPPRRKRSAPTGFELVDRRIDRIFMYELDFRARSLLGGQTNVYVVGDSTEARKNENILSWEFEYQGRKNTVHLTEDSGDFPAAFGAHYKRIRNKYDPADAQSAERAAAEENNLMMPFEYDKHSEQIVFGTDYTFSVYDMEDPEQRREYLAAEDAAVAIHEKMRELGFIYHMRRFTLLCNMTSDLVAGVFDLPNFVDADIWRELGFDPVHGMREFVKLVDARNVDPVGSRSRVLPAFTKLYDMLKREIERFNADFDRAFYSMNYGGILYPSGQ